MPDFRYIGLGEEINAAVSSEIKADTWLIYPTERSCREAITAFQESWQPLNVSFLSMDEFKQKVIYSNQIRLQEEKRLVCLFQAMTPEDREVFHIEKYPDLIDWGQHFFELFEELAEECVDAENLLQKMLDNDFSYQEWQLETYTRMLAIFQQYQRFISEKGYTDAIFDKRITNLHLPPEIKRYVFVNQYYYTGLETSVISQIEAGARQVIVFYQGCAQWLDEGSLKSSELSLEEAFPNKELPFRVKVYQSPNAWQMALSFLSNYTPQPASDKQKHFIIDNKFLQQPYCKVFNNEVFQMAEPHFIHRTALCHFFQTLADGLEKLVQAEGKTLIKLDWLLQAIGMGGFIRYFRADWDNRKTDRFIGFICSFSDRDVLYLDLKLDILKLREFASSEAEQVELLEEILALLSRFSRVRSIRQMLELIDVKGGIEIRKLMSQEELECSNLPEAFYEALANFMSMDELALVDDWQALYPGMQISTGILNLFMTFIKPKRYRYFYQDAAKPSAGITNLMDTRNLRSDKVTFLNLVEGELPGGRESVWLFNEKQRKAIGLKTWEDIRNWERYYFYRLLAGSEEVEFYTVSNQEKNIEPSSFINELTLYADSRTDAEKTDWQPAELPAQILLINWLRTDEANSLSAKVSEDVISSAGFFNLPCDPETDFGDKQVVSLSWSACEHFIRNPFLYYLQDLKKLKERTVKQEETMGRKMFGTMLHKYLNVINQRLAEKHQGVFSMKWEWINRDFLAGNLKAALAEPLLFYQIPRNYNQDYLNELITPFLIKTASWFFHVGLAQDADFQNQFITLIPETDDLTQLEWQYKLLIGPDQNAHKLGVAIRGKADLRLETKAKRFIIDFKTGEADILQLLFYMWFYYLIEQPELKNRVRAAFYKLMDKKLDWLDYKPKTDPSDLIRKLSSALDDIVRNGFAPASTAKQRKYLISVTRADLMRGAALDEDSE